MSPQYARTSKIGVLVVVSLALAAPPAAGQDAGILTVLGNFIGGFDVSVYAAPAGFVESDVFNERNELVEFGLFGVNKSASLLIGLDVLTGMGSAVPGLNFTGSVLTLPNIMVVHDEPLYVKGLPPLWANLGLGAGLSQLLNARAPMPVAAEQRIAEIKASGFHFGGTIGLSTYLGRGAGVFVDASLRHTILPSIDWAVGGSNVVPPSGWPTSVRFNTGTIRFGIGVGGQSKPDEGK